MGKGSPIVRILGLTLAALAVFGLTALVIAVLLSLVRGTPIDAPETVAMSSAAALAIWLIIARFHIKRSTIVINFHDRDIFFEKVKVQLGELGYEIGKQTENIVVFRPAFHSRLFGGNISMESDVGTALLTGPKVYLERLQKRLRNITFLEPLQRSLAEARRPRP